MYAHVNFSPETIFTFLGRNFSQASGSNIWEPYVNWRLNWGSLHASYVP